MTRANPCRGRAKGCTADCDDGGRCNNCRKAHNARATAVRQERKAARRCTVCGARAAKVDGAWLGTCPTHREYYAERARLAADSTTAGEAEAEDGLPPAARKALDRSLLERQRASDAEADAAAATERAVKALLSAGLSANDAGELLGLTRQRVRKMAGGSKTAEPEER